ncbi:diacylglycerol kinase 7 [Wolffia australiana]
MAGRTGDDGRGRTGGESPEAERATTTVAVRSSLMDSIKGCGMSGFRINKEDLRAKMVMPEYLRLAMAEAIRAKDADVGVEVWRRGGCLDGRPPESPVVLFVNSRSGGRLGHVLMWRMQDLIAPEQVFDLSTVKPSDFVQHGLACLERLADDGHDCARVIRERLRVMVAGGDGTVGWVLGSLYELHAQNREPVPPVGIIPLGTGNDLSRSFGWGGSFPFGWRAAVKKSLQRVISGPVSRLDSWRIEVAMPGGGEKMQLPHSLRYSEESTISLEDNFDGELPDKVSSFDGVFYNYFSIGMDAQIAYSFHHLRDEKPYLAQGPLSNKLIYSAYTCTQGWFVTPCVGIPGLRGLKNILKLFVKRVNSSDWEEVRIPSSVRAIVALNLHNYASGRNPWGNPKPEYLEKKGFVEAHLDDGLLEIFGLKQGWHASFVMVDLISAKHIAQAATVRLEIRGGQWKEAYMQMDGEPWKQAISEDESTFLEIRRVPLHSLMINGS